MDDASAGGLVSMDSGDADVDRDFAREEEVTEYVAPVARYSEEFAAMQLDNADFASETNLLEQYAPRLAADARAPEAGGHARTPRRLAAAFAELRALAPRTEFEVDDTDALRELRRVRVYGCLQHGDRRRAKLGGHHTASAVRRGAHGIETESRAQI